MTIQLNSDNNLTLHEAFRTQLNTLLSEELSRFSGHITRLEAHFSDENGHKDSSNTLLGKHPSEKELAYFDNAAQVDTNTPPAILFHSSNDTAVPVENSIAYYKALRKQKKSVEMHIYEDGGHGFGLLKASPGNSYKNWDNDLINWLKNRDLIQ